MIGLIKWFVVEEEKNVNKIIEICHRVYNASLVCIAIQIILYRNYMVLTSNGTH